MEEDIADKFLFFCCSVLLKFIESLPSYSVCPGVHTVACCLSSHRSSLQATANLALQFVFHSAAEENDNKGNILKSTKAFAFGEME